MVGSSEAFGRVAIVTGASRGIGQAIAWRLAAEGARVALVGRADSTRDKSLAGSLNDTVARIEQIAGAGSCIVVPADITGGVSETRGIVEAATNAFAIEPDVLVHAAAAPREFGGTSPPVGFAELSREFVMRAVEVNVWAFWELAQQMMPGMRTRGAGWLLAISSLQAAPRASPVDSSPVAMGGACAYGGTKAFLDRVVTGAAAELYGHNIAVNALAPTGPVHTPLSSTVVTSARPEDWEPMETMVEAALALVTADPQLLTSRIAYSLPLLEELRRPVRSLDGTELFDAWQPGRDDPRTRMIPYLRGH